MQSLTSNSVIQGNEKSPDQGLDYAKTNNTVNYSTLQENLTHSLDLLTDLVEQTYPKRGTKPKGTASVIKRASALLERQKPEASELQKNLDIVNNLYNKLREKNKKEAEQARKETTEREKKQINAATQRNLKEVELKRIAQEPPMADGTNPVRPAWTYYDEKNNRWRLNENELANELFSRVLVRRVEEKGKISDYARYNPARGQWELISIEYLKNKIDQALYNPKWLNPDHETQLYTEDLETAKAVNNIATLWLAKIEAINPQETFDTPPEYLVHCKTFDFDLMNWRKVPFSPDHYFVSGLRIDPSEDDITALTPPMTWTNASPEQAKQIEAMNDEMEKANDKEIDTLAPVVQDWLIQSLGDKDTERAFLERLGLSFIHNYDNNFWVFVKSAGGQGKSFWHRFLEKYVFQLDSVSNLDLDAMSKKGSFDASELRYKDINLTSEVETDFVPNTAINILKGLNGGDRKNFSQKFTKTASFTNFANLWFNTNHFPRFETYDDAVARRTDLFIWHSIKDFEKKFSRYELQREVPQLIVIAMYLARKCLKREPIKYDYFGVPIKLRRSRQMIDLYKDWSLTNDLVTSFIKEECVLDTNYKIGYSFLYQKLKDYIKANTDKPYKAERSDLQDKLATMNVFRSSKLTSWFEFTGSNKKTHKGSIVYEGITLKEFEPLLKEDINFAREQRQKGLARKKAMYK